MRLRKFRLLSFEGGLEKGRVLQFEFQVVVVRRELNLQVAQSLEVTLVP